jgi:hypothetical protein
MSARTFVVTVSDSPARVVVEDVRTRRRSVADDLSAVGGQIARLLDVTPPGDRPAARPRPAIAADDVSGL